MKRFWYEGFVGRRYVGATRHRGFLSFISGIAVAGLVVGVAVLIVVLSVMNGFSNELRSRILSLTAHATVSGLDGRIDDWPHKLAIVGRSQGVVAVAPYIEQQGMLVAEHQSAGVLLRGIEPGLESRVESIESQVRTGRLADLTAGSWRVILGNELAATLGVKRGDHVVLVIASGDVTPIGVLPRMRSFEVAGIVSAGMYEYDRRLALVSLADAQRLYRYGQDVTGLRLAVQDMDKAPVVVRRAALDLGGGFYVEDWTHRHENFFKSIEITKKLLFVILSLVVAVAAFNVIATVVMVVKDKRREIAILRTMGATPRSILSIFLVQGGLIGLIGVVCGILAGVLLARNLQSLVHGLERVLNTHFLDPRVYFMADLPARVSGRDVVHVAGFAFLLTLVSVLYPAWRAARMQPAESLRND
jgi:lipoprotein-releasing system permease protein